MFGQLQISVYTPYEKVIKPQKEGSNEKIKCQLENKNEIEYTASCRVSIGVSLEP